MKGFPELSITLGVSLRIKCTVAALHATWPPSAWWLEVLTSWPLGFPLFFSFWDWNPSLPHFFNPFRFWVFALFSLFICATTPTLLQSLLCESFFLFALRFWRYVLLFPSLFLFLHNLSVNFWSFSFSFFFFVFVSLLFVLWVFRIQTLPPPFSLVFHG